MTDVKTTVSNERSEWLTTIRRYLRQLSMNGSFGAWAQNVAAFVVLTEQDQIQLQLFSDERLLIVLNGGLVTAASFFVLDEIEDRYLHMLASLVTPLLKPEDLSS